MWKRTARGFTLVELLVSIAIVATLLAILLPALGYTVGSARKFRCQISLRSVAFDFGVFADDQLHGDRGHDTRDLGRSRFRVETFQESQYGLDEFWRWNGPTTQTLPDANKNDPMRCASVRGQITLHNNTPCSQGAITPAANVSYAFNMRLHAAEVAGPTGQLGLSPVSLTSAILEHGRVPLAWDVDGARASAAGAGPVFGAPGLGGSGPYASGMFWHPSKRHNGTVNVAFLDGSVSASSDPRAEPGWDWSFQPVR